MTQGSASVNPEDFIITRKRKKYKFALFANSPLCFEFEEWTKRPVDSIEVGAGTGLLSVELAARSPEKIFVAIDVKGDRLQKGAKAAEERGLTNVFFVRMRADQLSELTAEHSVENVWVTFPDPFPKQRSAGRRLTHKTYLKLYENLLSANGSLIVKHDNSSFFEWSLEQLTVQNWHIAELSFDVHESELADVYKLKTTYEQRWLDEGRTSKLVRARPPGRLR